MAIDKTVIRFLPYDVGDYGGNIGMRRSPGSGPSGVATAAFPGLAAFGSIANVWNADAPMDGWYSSLNTGSAGLTGAVREFEFILLGADGLTLDPLTISDDRIYIGVGGDGGAVYAGGIIEVGVYVGGVYAAIGTADLGIPYDWATGWEYDGAYEVVLDWSALPAPPAFWTALKDSIETS